MTDRLINEFTEGRRKYTNMHSQLFDGSFVISAERNNKMILYDSAHGYSIQENPLKLSSGILEEMADYENKAPLIAICNKEDNIACAINDKEKELFALRLKKRHEFDITIVKDKEKIKHDSNIDYETASRLISRYMTFFNEEQEALIR